MTTADMIDLAAAAVILLLTVMGVWRGLLKTVAGIAVLVIALLAAAWISSNFTDPIVEMVQPKVEAWMEERLGQAAEDMVEEADPSALEEVAGLEGDEALERSLEEIPSEDLEDLPSRMGLPPELESMLTERVGEQLDSLRSRAGSAVREAVQTAVRDVIRSLLPEFVRRGLFALTFVILSVVLKILTGVLSGAVRDIPLLGTIDRVGGGVLGLAEGLLLICAAVWILSGMEMFSGPPLSETRALLWLSTVLPLLAAPSGL